MGRVDELALAVAVALHQDGQRAVLLVQMRLTSSATSLCASSQEMRTYLLLPRFCGFRSPLGSQSTRLSGYLIRLGE